MSFYSPGEKSTDLQPQLPPEPPRQSHKLREGSRDRRTARLWVIGFILFVVLCVIFLAVQS
jgi:hypothetical protein